MGKQLFVDEIKTAAKRFSWIGVEMAFKPGKAKSAGKATGFQTATYRSSSSLRHVTGRGGATTAEQSVQRPMTKNQQRLLRDATSGSQNVIFTVESPGGASPDLGSAKSAQ